MAASGARQLHCQQASKAHLGKVPCKLSNSILSQYPPVKCFSIIASPLLSLNERLEHIWTLFELGPAPPT